jgi:hypothetical protein
MRTLSAIASRAFGYIHQVNALGWTGVGSPCVTNSNISQAAAQVLILINSPAGGGAAVIPQNVYQDFSAVSTIGAISVVDPTSFPYLVVGLGLLGAGDLSAGFASSGDLFEYDSLFASIL